ncbi:MAG: hypothetical protein RLZZ319_845 [Actinomycetota bacterium]|jgi:hypothetical protein
MRRFLLNGGFLSALFSGFGLIRSTISGKRDWKLGLMWVSWILSLVVVIATILSPDEDEDY